MLISVIYCAEQSVTTRSFGSKFHFFTLRANGVFPGLRYPRIAVSDYSFTSKCLDQKRLHLVNYPG